MERISADAVGMALLIPLMVIFAFWVDAMKRKDGDPDFDERQVAARGKACKAALLVLAIYLIEDAILINMWRPWAKPGVDVLMGVWLAFVVFLCVAIHYDAYRALREKPLGAYSSLGFFILLPLLSSRDDMRDGLLTDGLLTNGLLNENCERLVYTVSLLVALVVLTVHDIRRRRSEKDAEREE